MSGDRQELQRPGHFGTFDEHGVDTPEQVELRFPLAGLGSRFLALLVDLAIQFAANILLVILVAVALAATARTGALNRMSDTAGKWFVAGIILVYFLLFWGYFSLFEAFSNGQTPGKRVLKIRVIKDSGRQITFFEALARNLLRVVDALPGVYLVGVLSILFTKGNKRLGDLVADTLVIHERVEEFGGYIASPTVFASPEIFDVRPGGVPADRIALLDEADLRLIDNYLSRAFALPIETRGTLASRLLDGLCDRMGVAVPMEVAPERTLEGIAQALRGGGAR
ncbi:MAG: RDD family protein [Janthinobacterium lividum]